MVNHCLRARPSNCGNGWRRNSIRLAPNRSGWNVAAIFRFIGCPSAQPSIIVSPVKVYC